MKRIFDLQYPHIMKFSKSEFLTSLKESHGRSVCVETNISVTPLLTGISNPETASAFGADLITLNSFDFDAPFIEGYDDIEIDLFADRIKNNKGINQKIEKNAMDAKYIQKFKALVGRFIGVKLIPVPEAMSFPEGLRLSQRNLMQFKRYGIDYIVISDDESVKITNEDIVRGIKETRKKLGQNVLIIAGRSSFYDDSDYEKAICLFAEAGADVITLPSPASMPCFTLTRIESLIHLIHQSDCLAMTLMNSGQEDSHSSQIESQALSSKSAGADIQHLGPNGSGGMTSVENLMALSIAIRGKHHTYTQMARSKQRK